MPILAPQMFLCPFSPLALVIKDAQGKLGAKTSVKSSPPCIWACTSQLFSYIFSVIIRL